MIQNYVKIIFETDLSLMLISSQANKIRITSKFPFSIALDKIVL